MYTVPASSSLGKKLTKWKHRLENVFYIMKTNLPRNKRDRNRILAKRIENYRIEILEHAEKAALLLPHDELPAATTTRQMTEGVSERNLISQKTVKEKGEEEFDRKRFYAQVTDMDLDDPELWESGDSVEYRLKKLRKLKKKMETENK